MTDTPDEKFPKVRFPKELRDGLAEEAEERAVSRGINPKKYSIADYIGERRIEWNQNEQEPEEDE